MAWARPIMRKFVFVAALATHVEAKTALMMREGEIASGVVVINHEEGPCPGAYSCQAVLGVLLPEGYVLTVWWPGMNRHTFTGQEG
jgi:nucleic acid/nucleotide deaminase of polymorphic system toxin